MKREHRLDLDMNEVTTLEVALQVYVDSFGDLDYHPNSQIGQTVQLIKRIKAIQHGDKSAGAYQNK